MACAGAAAAIRIRRTGYLHSAPSRAIFACPPYFGRPREEHGAG